MRARKTTVFASPDVPESIASKAAAIGAGLVVAGRDYKWTSRADGWTWQGRSHRLEGLRRPSLAGDFQIGNAAGVLALLESAGFGELFTTDIVNRAFAKPALPGRLQRVTTDRHWLLDVAHNPAAAEVLGQALAAGDFNATTVAIVSMLNDKDVAGIISPLSRHVDYWVSVTASNSRAIEAAEIGRQVANLTNKACMVAESLEQALQHARQLTTYEDRILVTGSFYLVGPVLAALGIYSSGKGET